MFLSRHWEHLSSSTRRYHSSTTKAQSPPRALNGSFGPAAGRVIQHKQVRAGIPDVFPTVNILFTFFHIFSVNVSVNNSARFFRSAASRSGGFDGAPSPHGVIETAKLFMLAEVQDQAKQRCGSQWPHYFQ